MFGLPLEHKHFQRFACPSVTVFSPLKASPSDFMSSIDQIQKAKRKQKQTSKVKEQIGIAEQIELCQDAGAGTRAKKSSPSKEKDR